MNTSFLLNKTFRRAALASAIALGIFGASNSFALKSATSNSSADVIVPIEIAKSADLNFGRFAPGTGGSVTISTSGARTASGTILSTINSSPLAGQFDVKGDVDATYTITFSGAEVLTDSVSTETMTLDKISNLVGGDTTTGEVTEGKLDASGEQSIFLGGKLTVSSDQAAGNYIGDVTATVEYN
jgi:hypothetical protein